MTQEDGKPVSPLVIADHLWNSTNQMVTSCMDKKSYQIGAMEAVKYMRNHPESPAPTEGVEHYRAIIDKLREGLDKIAYPLKWMQKNLKEGEQLNGAAAIQLANDANYLKGIAKKLLQEYEMD